MSKSREYTERYLTTEHIEGQRFSKGFYEDVAWFEKRGIPARIQLNYNGAGLLRMTTTDGSLLPVSQRKDWTHNNNHHPIVTDKKPVFLPEDLFEI